MNTKRFLSVLMFANMLPILALAAIWQDPKTKVNYMYTVGESEASVSPGGTMESGSPDATGDIAILPTITVNGKEYTVTSIGDRAFRYNLTGVSIPSTVTSIGEYAFLGCNLASISIPSSVKTIGKDAFRNCSSLTSVHISDIGAWSSILFKSTESNPLYHAKHLYLNSAEVTNLVIPESVTTIGDYAFICCSSLTSVTIPNTVTTIGYDAFYGCSGLTSLIIPNSVISIGYAAFAGCGGITSVTMGSSVKTIDGHAFGGCSSLTAVHISDLAAWCAITFGSEEANPLTMANHLYVNNSKVEKLVIPSSVTSIGDYAFNNCTDLTSVTIPNTVRNIGTSAFYGCVKLDSFTIPKSVTRVGQFAFEETAWYDRQPDGLLYKDNVLLPNKGEMKLIYERNGGFNDHIRIKSGTRVIADYAFASHGILASVTIPNTVTSIGDYAFYATALTSVTIPSSVTSIGNGAFSDCYSLDNVTIPSSVTSLSDNLFWQCTNLSNVTIPEGVTSIGKEAFCITALTSVTIPSSVKSIGNGAFSECNNLTSVTSLIRNPFMIDRSVFLNTDYSWYGYTYFTSATLYVPKGTKAKYKATDGWKNFSTIVEVGVSEEETVPVGNALVAGYSSDKALDFTGSDVTAWIATGVRGGNIQLSRVDIAPANTGLYVKASKAGDYDVPVATEKTYYVNMFQPVVTATTVQPTVTNDGVTYQTLSFALSKETGKPGFFPNTAAKNYGDNKMYLQLPEWVLTAPTTGTTTSERVPVTIGTLGVAGFSSDKNLDFTSSDVEAWVATGFKGGNVQLTRVYAVPAGTGIYVKSKKTLTASTTFQIPVTTEVPYYVNLFVGLPNGGTVSPTEVVGGVTMQTLNFATSKTTGKPAFFPITEDKTYGAGKMYLRLPADLVNGSDAARSLGLVFVDGDNVSLMESETTGISGASYLNDDEEMINSGVVYDLQGRKLQTSNFKLQISKLPKGIYIIGGKKVVIK